MNYRPQQGFTLMNVMFAIAIATLAAVAFLPDYRSEIGQRFSRIAASEIWLLQEAAQIYYANNGHWPNPTERCRIAHVPLRGAGLLSQWSEDFTPFGGRYTTRCDHGTAPYFEVIISTGTDPAIVSPVPLPSGTDSIFHVTNRELFEEWAVDIAQNIPFGAHHSTLSDTFVVSRVPTVAGLINASSSDFLLRDGSRSMTGALNLGNNNITAVKDLLVGGNIDGMGRVRGTSMESTGNARVGGNLEVNGRVTINGSDVCLSTGQCLSEVAVKVYENLAHNAYVPKPTCPGGTTPHIAISLKSFAGVVGHTFRSVQARALDVGPRWRVQLTTQAGGGHGGSAVAVTKCQV